MRDTEALEQLQAGARARVKARRKKRKRPSKVPFEHGTPEYMRFIAAMPKPGARGHIVFLRNHPNIAAKHRKKVRAAINKRYRRKLLLEHGAEVREKVNSKRMAKKAEREFKLAQASEKARAAAEAREINKTPQWLRYYLQGYQDGAAVAKGTDPSTLPPPQHLPKRKRGSGPQVIFEVPQEGSNEGIGVEAVGTCPEPIVCQP